MADSCLLHRARLPSLPSVSTLRKSTLHKIQFIDEDSTELVHLRKSNSKAGFVFTVEK